MEVREKYIARLMKNPDSLGFTEIKFVHAPQLQLSHGVRLRCQYTCPATGKVPTSPPQTPDVEQMAATLQEFKFGIMVRREVTWPYPSDLGEMWREFQQALMEAENEAFIRGYGNAFALAVGNCLYCHHDDSMRPCLFSGIRRPTFEAVGINLQETLTMLAWEQYLLREPEGAFQMFGLLLLN